jgi:hypothetical protein
MTEDAAAAGVVHVLTAAPAQAAKMNSISLPYMLQLSQSVRPVPDHSSTSTHNDGFLQTLWPWL